VIELVCGGPDPEKVMRDTWGHMDAAPNVKHPGAIVFVHGTYDELIILSVDFGDTAGDGPWFYEHLHAWLIEQDTQPGTCYRFTGWYRHDGEGNHEFVGDTTVLRLTD
jgi:hypothetical protein